MNTAPIIHQLLFSTLRIEVQSPINSVGTAFIVCYRKGETDYLFLVTNRHVIRNADNTKFFFTQADKNIPLIGKSIDITFSKFEKMWFCNPNNEDIAVMPFYPLIQEIEKKTNKTIYFKAIPLTFIPSKEQEDKLTALEEIIFVGYPNALFDNKNLLPIIRKGITATPLFIDYEGEPRFLIDASVFPGSSGSPVFIYNFGSYTTAEGTTTIGSRVYFIGIVSGVFFRASL